ncbi:ADP-ribosylation factor-like protein 16 isoform X2 [Mizuhopecten yessoensis]|uniref:ADP-ribosylation factor-like protein 16 isoform X2 n=1 Tax=Mizuhopecten yessoensis TaxID=6573 RepID=UPI000B45B525|nr:ADP-ribosylation factor-like protein 16 isoform X2 [Mizuhopecten yessoensis]
MLLVNIKVQDPLGGSQATIPTAGTNLVDVLVTKKQEVVVREMGGIMSPIWPKYIKDCSTLMFMVDMSNRLQVAAGCILLLTTLSDRSLVTDKVLILLNKIDLPTCMSRFEFESLFRLDDVLKQSKLQVSVIEVSAHTGQGLGDVLDWLAHNTTGEAS